MNYYRHKLAVVDPGATIGENTKIWHLSHLMGNAKVGKNCVIGQNCFVAGKVGDNCKLQNNVNVYQGVELGNGVFCGPSMTFTNDLHPRANYPKNGNYVRTCVSDGATIGANATIICGIKIGKSAFIGAGSVVTKDVSDYALVYGNPAKVHGWVCECGEKLAARSKSLHCQNCDRKYRKAGKQLQQIR